MRAARGPSGELPTRRGDQVAARLIRDANIASPPNAGGLSRFEAGLAECHDGGSFPGDPRQLKRDVPSPGPPSVVCLHGLGRTPSDWDGVRAGLEPFGTVRTPRLPRDVAGARQRVDDAVKAGDIVIGHSMGGVLALRLGRESPRPLRALILTGCFFPPARNGRSPLRTIGDYASHRLAFVRSLDRSRERGEPRGGSVGALTSLIRLAARPTGFDAALAAVGAPLLVVHARDDHHVPIDFALAAARSPEVAIRVLDRGGHHAHTQAPARWLGAVTPWLQEIGAN